MASLQRGLKGH